jgi:hypothetical protein
MANDTETAANKSHRAFTLFDATQVILGHSPGDVQANEQVLIPFTRRNDVALVHGDQARGVVVALERAGVEGDRISFLRLDDASVTPQGDATPTPRLDIDRPLHSREERSVAVGALIGAVVGAVLAFLVVLAIADVKAAVWALLGGGVLGGALGTLWAGFGRLGASDAWERSLHADPDAWAVIGVHLDDDGSRDRASEILEPYGVWVFDHDGSVLRRPPAGGNQ